MSEIAELRHFTSDEYLAMPDTAPAVVDLFGRLKQSGLVT